MRKSHYTVFGRLDMASRAQKGTVTIDRATGIFEVRPFRRRKTYALPLGTVADMVCQALVRLAIVQKKREKLARRKAR